MVFPNFVTRSRSCHFYWEFRIIIGSSDEGKRLRSRPPFAAIATKPPALWEFLSYLCGIGERNGHVSDVTRSAERQMCYGRTFPSYAVLAERRPRCYF